MTAVEWLITEISNSVNMPFKHFDELKEEAKEMERQQLQLAYASRCSFFSCENNNEEELANCSCGKNYYEETFKK